MVDHPACQLKRTLPPGMGAPPYNECHYNNPHNTSLFFPPVIDGVAANVHGVQGTRTGALLNSYDWRTLWIG